MCAHGRLYTKRSRGADPKEAKWESDHPDIAEVDEYGWVTSTIVGSITEKDVEPYLHLHINLCDENMNIHGGHLTACRISGTCELTVTVLEGHVGRKHDEVTGLNLFEFD